MASAENAVPFDNLQTHTVTMGLRLVEALGLPTIGQVQTPRVPAENWHQRLEQLGLTGITNYVVIHPNPKFRYKMWDSNKWIALICWLRQQGIEVLLTGSGDPSEAAYVRDIASKVPEGCRCLTGLLSLAETAELLKGAERSTRPEEVGRPALRRPRHGRHPSGSGNRHTDHRPVRPVEPGQMGTMAEGLAG